MNNDINKSRNELLKELAKLGDNAMIKTLIDNGATEIDGSLLLASHNGHNDVVKTLLEHGADVHVKNDFSLFLAAGDGHNDVVKTLLEYGADINIIHNGDTVLLNASKFGHNEVVKTLLIDYKAKVSDEDIAILKEKNCTFTLDLIAKRDLEQSLQQEIKPIEDNKIKTNTGKL